jgi:hypothetical protein
MPLTEVSKWDLEDIDKYNALLDMKADYKTAYGAFQNSKPES